MIVIVTLASCSKMGISKNDSLFSSKNNIKMKLEYLFPFLTQQGSLTPNKPSSAPMLPCENH